MWPNKPKSVPSIPCITTNVKENKNIILGSIRWEHMVAGVSGGVVSTLLLHPLDLVKVRFQVNEGSATHRPQYKGIRDAFLKIYKNEGVKGLYQGVTPNVWGSGASWGLYFLFYSTIKTAMLHGDDTQTLSAPGHMLAASEAGILTLALTNPIWVAKTRLCLQYDITTAKAALQHDTQYRGMADCLFKTFKGEGVRGLYKGFIPGLFGVSHGAIQFMAYEELKKYYNKYKKRPLTTKFGTGEYLAFAALSKILAASITYPYQVVRARLQDQHRHFNGVWDVLKRTWRYEGFRGYFKGLSPYLLHVTPNICIVFLIYENVTSLQMFRRIPVAIENDVSGYHSEQLTKRNHTPTTDIPSRR